MLIIRQLTFGSNKKNVIDFLLRDQNNAGLDNIPQILFFEKELEDREKNFQETIGKQNHFTELFDQYKDFLVKYLNKCISLHSKIEINIVMQNIDECLHNNYDFTNHLEIQQCLQNMKIAFDFANQSLNCLDDWTNNDVNQLKRNINNPNNFIPSSEQLQMKYYDQEKIEHIIESDRWIVILGDPGCAKTTLLRWIVLNFSKKILQNEQKRIPILIRIDEFSSWLNEHPTKTLMDYIGKHTWFSQNYSDDDESFTLKQFIIHGHALILLDGLDEIGNLEQRAKIVELVRKFICEHVRTPDFISGFDETHSRIYENPLKYLKILKIQPPDSITGNQIVIKSRFVGYSLYSLTSPSIRHYSLPLMDQSQAKEFAKKWINEVDANLFEIVSEERVKILSEKRYQSLEKLLQSNSEFNKITPALLSLICTSIFQSIKEFSPESRIEVYDYIVQAAMHIWTNESLMNEFLINLATYLHLYSQSSLIDAFDMESLCCFTLQQHRSFSNRQELHKHAKKMISSLEFYNVIVSAKGLETYGFFHLSFQEYFVAQNLLRDSSREKVVEKILSFSIDFRLHESVCLAIEWISWKWSIDEYEQFWKSFLSQGEKSLFPVGSLFLFETWNHLYKFPSKAIIFIALNNILHSSSDYIRESYLISNLINLSDDLIIQWMNSSLIDNETLAKFLSSLPNKASQFNDNHLQTKLKIIFERIPIKSIGTNNSVMCTQELPELNEFWNHENENHRIMTSSKALLITECLSKLNEENMRRMIQSTLNCELIEVDALGIIKHWLDYRKDKHRRYFALYAALQLIQHGSDEKVLLDIIKEEFVKKKEFSWKHLLESVLNSSNVQAKCLTELLDLIPKDLFYSYLWIHRQETYDSLLEMTFQRINSMNAFLSVFPIKTKDLFLHVFNYFRSQVEKDVIHEQHCSNLISWLIGDEVRHHDEQFCNYVDELLWNQRFPKIQKAILYQLNLMYITHKKFKKNQFLQDKSILYLEQIIRLWNEYPEDFIIDCLITYGNSLYNSNQITEETKTALMNICKTSSSERIVISAEFCLAMSQQSNSAQVNSTIKHTYRMLIQKTLYRKNFKLYRTDDDFDQIRPESEYHHDNYFGFNFNTKQTADDYIHCHSNELMDLFVNDLYDYLEKYKDYELTPDYVEIASKVIKKNREEFCNSIRKSSFGENLFKDKICSYTKKNPTNSQNSMNIYLAFGIIDNQFIDLFQQIHVDSFVQFTLQFDFIKEISDRDVIEKLFELLKMTISEKQFTLILNIFKKLIEINRVSLLELHENLFDFRNISYDDDDEKTKSIRENIIKLLLTLSGFV
ncbi:unnamed protein product [Adineta ricciae]|uniref:NACHT domain-containing protein n=1 Tax=Adineta ricciae TaxID=249248 RepID=A0A814SW97_ADIRI|nr:unnamed protein product [Adineta ricciae]